MFPPCGGSFLCIHLFFSLLLLLGTAANGKKAVGPVHDTHLQVHASHKKYSPGDLSMFKCDKERKEIEAIRRQRIVQQQQQLQLQQQQLQQAQQAQAQAQQQQQQQQQAQSQSQQTTQQNQAQTTQTQVAQQATTVLPQNVPQIRTQVGTSQNQQWNIPAQQQGSIPVSSQMMQAQQMRVLQAQAQQNQVQSQQTAQQVQLAMQAGQLQSGQTGAAIQINGIPQAGASVYATSGRVAGAASPAPAHGSPPRTSATPVSSATGVAGFSHPASAQRAPGIQMPAGQMLPMAGTQVPIARTNSALAAYFNGTYTQEQMAQVLRHYHMVRYSSEKIVVLGWNIDYGFSFDSAAATSTAGATGCESATGADTCPTSATAGSSDGSNAIWTNAPRRRWGVPFPGKSVKGGIKSAFGFFDYFILYFACSAFLAFRQWFFVVIVSVKTYQLMFNNVFFSLSACGSREMRHSYSAVRLR